MGMGKCGTLEEDVSEHRFNCTHEACLLGSLSNLSNISESLLEISLHSRQQAPLLSSRPKNSTQYKRCKVESRVLALA